MKKIIFVFFLFVLSNCSKNVPGPQGDPGEPGKNGNAKQSLLHNVGVSQWLTDGSEWTTKIFSDHITDEVIKSGEVEVYMQVGNAWWALPYAVGDLFMEFRIEKGQVHLKYSKIHGIPPASPGLRYFKISVIEPVY